MSDVRAQFRTGVAWSVAGRRCRGFTVLEGLLAGVVLAMSAAVLSVGMSQSLRALGDARDRQYAAALLDELLTRVDVIGPQALYYDGPNSGRFEAPHEKFSWQLTIANTGTLDLYQVTAKVIWPVGDAVQVVEAVTLLNDAPDSRSVSIHWEDL